MWFGGIEDELAFAAAGDKAGFGEDFQVVGDGGGCDAAEFDQLSAADLRMTRDVLVDFEPGAVAEGLGDFFDLGQVHVEVLSDL